MLHRPQLRKISIEKVKAKSSLNTYETYIDSINLVASDNGFTQTADSFFTNSRIKTSVGAKRFSLLPPDIAPIIKLVQVQHKIGRVFRGTGVPKTTRLESVEALVGEKKSI